MPNSVFGDDVEGIEEEELPRDGTSFVVPDVDAAGRLLHEPVGEECVYVAETRAAPPVAPRAAPRRPTWPRACVRLAAPQMLGYPWHRKLRCRLRLHGGRMYRAAICARTHRSW